MAAQDIYITPKQILSYLKDFEEKLPLPQKDYFVSTLTTKPLTIAALNNEVNKMAEFIGLNGFTANCKWGKLPKGIGGQICLDGRRSGTLDIEINAEYQNELEVTRATLAHELCHKYLQCHGIYYPTLTEINETYTDLCTMYVGFGNIIIQGYSTDRWKSGYLQFPIYKRMHNLVRAIIWGEIMAITDDYGEPFLTHTLRTWFNHPDKKLLARKIYKHAFREFSDYQRNVEIFKQLLSMLEEEPLRLAEQVDEKMYQPEWFDADGELKQKVACFISVYEGIVIKEKYKDTSIHTMNRHLQHVIAFLVDAIGRNKFPTNRINRLYFECPYCRHRALASKIANSETIVKCPNCKKRFAVNGEELDLLPARNDISKFKDELAMPQRKAYEEGLKREKKSYEDAKQRDKAASYSEGFKAGQESKNKELQKKIASLPWWIKMLIGKRLR
mgnify:CR=1 FL=1